MVFYTPSPRVHILEKDRDFEFDHEPWFYGGGRRNWTPEMISAYKVRTFCHHFSLQKNLFKRAIGTGN